LPFAFPLNRHTFTAHKKIIMKLTSTFRPFAAALLTALALAPFADARHEKSLPADTYVAVQLSDVADLQKRLEVHPLWVDGQKAGFEEYFAPAIKRFKDELKGDSKGKDAQRVFETLKRDVNGEILFAVVKTPKVEKGHEPHDYVLFVDTLSDEKTIATLLEDAELLKEEKHEIRPPDADDDAVGAVAPAAVSVVIKNASATFQGVTLHERTVTVGKEEPTSLGGWALVNKTFIYASAPNVLRDLVDAVQNGRKDSLDATGLWKRSRDAAGKADLFAFANAPLATSELQAYIVRQFKDKPPNPFFPVDVIKAYNALALDSIEGAWWSGELTADGFYNKSSFTFSAKRGLLSLLTFKPLATPVPSFIPAGVSHFGVTQWDTGAAWKNLEVLLSQALPELKPVLDLQLNNLKTQEGLDIRGAVLENFGEGLVSISDFGGEDSGKTGLEALLSVGSVYVIGIRDTDKLASLVETALSKSGKGGDGAIFDEREFMGVKIRTFKAGAAGGPKVSYALNGGYLFYSNGAAGLLEKIIAEIKDPQHPAAKVPEVLQALKRAPKDLINFEYAELGSALPFFTNLVEFALEKDGKKGLLDTSKRPSAASLPWVATGYSVERGNEIYSESVLFRKETK
jgi:hypothetical protein